MENNVDQNTTTDLLKPSDTQLFNDLKSEKEEFEEDETETPILSREINSCLTKPYNELGMSQNKDLDYNLVKFDLAFSSENAKYNWKVYHTPKEIRKHINSVYSKIINGEIECSQSIHPSIIKIKKDQHIIDNLPNINNFYLQLFNEPKNVNNQFLNNFFCISRNSFLKQNAGVKPFEGWVDKKVDKHCCRKCFMVCCPCCELCLLKRYNKRWVVVHDDCLFYLNDPSQREGKIVYFFDKNMKIESDGSDCLKIKNEQMSLTLRYNNFFEKEYWRNELERRRNNYALLVQSNKYMAYTNSKKYNVCKWFSDGKDYFEDLYINLMNAKYSIYITDWWMSPEVFLRRPVYEKEYIDMAEKKLISKNFGMNMSRLMDILDYKARQGVQVYILVYYEMSLALTLNSAHTEEAFKKINKNIKVTRHPSGAGTLLWSHHEKLVIIDQMIGYVGGLDLCWGRYDNHNHPIYEPPNSQGLYEFPLIDYSNARICDFSKVENYWIESVPRKDTIRMPWHDVHSRIIGPAVSDIARHFIERWNHANFADRKSRGLTSINQTAVFSQNKFNFWEKFTEILKKKNIKIQQRKSLENPLGKLKTVESKNLEDLKIGGLENRKLQEEFMKGKKKIDDDHLLQLDDAKTNTTSGNISSQKPSYYSKLVKNMGKMGSQAMAIDQEYEIANTEMYSGYFQPGCIMSEVQVLRSSSEWSAGLRNTENSILQGYYELIENSKHYIYIENQFFVSKSWTDEEKNKCKHSISDIVQNQIAYFLRLRIEKAYRDKEKFRVYVFLPLLPGFAGEPEESGTLQIIVKHTYAGICRNYGLSLIEQLEKIMGDQWKNYIGFYSLRNHALVNGAPKTEIIYIHSKLMIVDDTKVLIGSANINDRSMIGSRDSEFAVIIKERKEIIDQKTKRNFLMNGNKYLAANFATSFRRALMGEHLGINPNDPILDDPVSDQLHNFIIQRANNNTKIYHTVFGCYPDDSYTNINLLQNAKKEKETEDPKAFLNKYMGLKDKIVGHIVEYPLLFLKEEELGKSFFSVENLVPEYNFT
jgi:phospholipase D1/2